MSSPASRPPMDEEQLSKLFAIGEEIGLRLELADGGTEGLAPIPEETLRNLLCRAEEIGLRLELTDAGISWEALPGLRHQELMTTIFATVRRGDAHRSPCDCYAAVDLAIRFPDGVVKRPDVAVFCKRPSDEEGFVRAIPEAVVEITSPGYEDNDLVSGPHIYLRNGVKDVLVLHRPSMEVHHWASGARRTSASATVFAMQCGVKSRSEEPERNVGNVTANLPHVTKESTQRQLRNLQQSPS